MFYYICGSDACVTVVSVSVQQPVAGACQKISKHTIAGVPYQLNGKVVQTDHDQKKKKNMQMAFDINMVGPFQSKLFCVHLVGDTPT